MAAPVKAFIDPSGLYLVMQPVPVASPNKEFLLKTNQFGWPVQIEETVPRFTIAFPTFMMSGSPVVSPKPNTKEGKNMAMNTFSSIYQERTQSATRGTEGQLYPYGI